MISASRAYQNNVEVMNTSKDLMLATLRLGQSNAARSATGTIMTTTNTNNTTDPYAVINGNKTRPTHDEEQRARPERVPEADDRAAEEPGPDEAAGPLAVHEPARAVQPGDEHAEHGEIHRRASPTRCAPRRCSTARASMGHHILARRQRTPSKPPAARSRARSMRPKGIYGAEGRGEGRGRHAGAHVRPRKARRGPQQLHLGRHQHEHGRRRRRRHLQLRDRGQRRRRDRLARPACSYSKRRRASRIDPSTGSPHPEHQRRRHRRRATSAASSDALPNTFQGDTKCLSVLRSPASTPPPSDLTVTANNIANVATTGFKGSRAEFADLFATSQQGVSATAIGNGVKRRERLAAVLPGQHRLHRQQPGPRDERPGLLRHERQRRAVLLARRRVPGEQRRLRGERQAASACRCIRRSPTAASTPAACRT